ncbi:MAG TPA: tetratricopeptide repeat protein, partial [Polymorphobacter sp.]|nr:tetratricopeptide repeat protein [Polymorphobacter sp.]
PDSLARRARVVQLIGTIQDQRGNLDAALANFETAAASTAELLARDPENPQRIFDHSQSVFYVGYIAYRRGNFAKAEPAFRTYLDLATRLVARDPANAAWQAELGYAQSNLATLRYAQGRNTEAAALFNQALTVSRQVARSKVDDVTTQLNLATTLAWLAATHERLGELDKARSVRAEEDEILLLATGRDPDNRTAQRMQVESLRSQARIALVQARPAESLRAVRAAARLASDLLVADPTNADWLAEAVNTHLQLADTLLQSGNPGAAIRQLDVANHLANTLGARDRSVAKWQMLRIQERVLRARIHNQTRNPAQALAVARAALAGIGGLSTIGRDDSDMRWLRAGAHLEAGEALLKQGSAPAARVELAMIANSNAVRGIEEPRLMVLRARALAALGDHGAEAKLAARLRAIGWLE